FISRGQSTRFAIEPPRRIATMTAETRRRLTRIAVIVIAVCLVLAAVLGFGVWYYLFREDEPVFSSDEDHFKYASIGTENQDGIPYWVWLVLPRLFPEKLPGAGGYTSLGLRGRKVRRCRSASRKRRLG